MDNAPCQRSAESEDSLPAIDVDVVVIGAGISGLATAYYIQKKDTGIRLAVLEAKGIGLLFQFNVWLIVTVLSHRPYEWRGVIIADV